jgi:hypothetical protein
MSAAELLHSLGLQDRKSFRERYLSPALASGLIEMTLHDRPNSRLQKYRLTEAGRSWLANNPTNPPSPFVASSAPPRS